MAVSLERADGFYREGSYRHAAEQYAAVLKDGAVPASRLEEVQHRLCICYGRSEQWDQALEAGLRFIQEQRRTLWAARGLHWLGRLYRALPNEAYQITLPGADGGPPVTRLYRGTGQRGLGVPQNEDGSPPKQVYCYQENRTNALEALEAALIVYRPFRSEPEASEEEIQLCFDLARLLEEELRAWVSEEGWQRGEHGDPAIVPDASYSPDWPVPQKILFLYARIGALAGPAPGGSKRAAAGLAAEALWLETYQREMARAATRLDEDSRGQGVRVQIPYLYQDRKPEELFRRLLRELPESSMRDEAWFMLALFLGNESRFPEAVEELRALSESGSTKGWRDAAAAELRTITRRELSLELPGPQPPGQQPAVRVFYRNLNRIRFTIRRFDLEGAFKGQGHRRRALTEPFPGLELSLKQARQFYGERVAMWEADLPDTPEYRFHSEILSLPVTEPGAYVVEAEAPHLVATGLLLITDLALVMHTSPEGALFFVVHAETGEPQPGARIVCREAWHGRKQNAAFQAGEAGADGLFFVPHPEAGPYTTVSFQGLAVRDGRYALVAERSTWRERDGLGAERVKIFCVTDRPVYRPGQTVYYRQLVMQEKEGQWVPAVGMAVRGRVIDREESIIAEFSGRTNAFGACSGTFTLPEDAALGDYYLLLPASGRRFDYTAARTRFRVEEYRKPEFQVAVTPDVETIRHGETVRARVRASYYFGGPVQGATVGYSVYRKWYTWDYHFPDPVDFLRDERHSDDGYFQGRGEQVAQGEALTDENGEAVLTFSTELGEYESLEEEALYEIEVEVRDASRRVISGTGTVKATRRDFAFFLRPTRGYFNPGEGIEVEAAGVNAAEQPVSVEGLARFFRQRLTPEGIEETLVHEYPLHPGEDGRALIRWAPADGGPYRVALESRDSSGKEVTGSAEVWVRETGAPEYAALRGIRLRVERTGYREGETARILLTAPEGGCTALLLRVAGGAILDRQVVSVPDGSVELTVPLGRADVPNVFLSAITVRRGLLHHDVQEVVVLPARQFAQVEVEAGPDRCRPGETAQVRLRVRDQEGKPLRAELSLAVTDASLAYIQRDLVPDIRTCFCPERRQPSAGTEGSPQARFRAHVKDEQRWPTRGNLIFRLPRGCGTMGDWPGLPDRSRYSLWPRYHFYEPEDTETDEEWAGTGLTSTLWGGRRETIRYLGGAPAEPGVYACLAISEYAPADQVMAKRMPDSAPEPDPRRHFADTAFWAPAVVTGADGTATVEFAWPDNLTEWRALTVGVSEDGQVGSGEARVRTRKDLLVRLQAPRFLVEGDEVTLSANVHSFLAQPARVRIRLEMEHEDAVLLSPSEWGGIGEREVQIELQPEGEARVDWRVQVRQPGPLVVRVAARSEEGSDAVEGTLPVVVRGVERVTIQNGELREENRDRIVVELPQARRPGSAELVVRFSPSLAAAVLDALLYLIDYPYGCVEQTLSRFVPAVLTAQTLADLGLDLEAVRKRSRLLRARELAAGSAIPDVENSPYTYPEGRSGLLTQAGGENPVFDSGELRKVVAAGLARLRKSQNGDGGWGWWPGGGSDLRITAYVVQGLLMASQAGYRVEEAFPGRGLDFLRKQFSQEDDAYSLAVAGRALALDPEARGEACRLVVRHLEPKKEELGPYGKALLARTFHDLGMGPQAQMVLRNLEATVRTDSHHGTAWWIPQDRCWWRWENNTVETAAAALQAYLAVDPESPLAAMLMRWLVRNRKGTAWRSTRETALAVQALLEYARVREELAPDYTLTLDLAGRASRSFRVTPENVLSADALLVIPDELLETGPQALSISKEGTGAVYYTAITRYFSQEDPIPASSHGIGVRRDYYRLRARPQEPGVGQKAAGEARPNPFLTGDYTLLEETGDAEPAGELERIPITPGEPVASGEMLEVELFLEADNDYEYLLFEDIKPAGCEPVDVRSESRWGEVSAYMELRDQKVAFFIDSLPHGKSRLSYRVRAEAPGVFRVLPAHGYAMYAPEIRALSEEQRLQVRD
jgi:alpha-2-macroglobulin